MARPGCIERFVAATEHLDNGIPVVSVMGEVDLATAPVLEETLLGMAEGRADRLIVDLTGCSFLDSRGLQALVKARARLERPNRPLTLVLSNPGVLKVFRITGCDALFEIHSSRGAAVNGNSKGNGHR